MQSLLEFLSENGVWAVLINVFLAQIGVPVPAMPTLIVAGALTARGELSLPAICAAAFAAALVADLIWYALGVRHGHRVLKTLCRVSLSPDSCVRQTEAIYHKWGMSSLVASKFVAGFSTVAPPLAGALGAKPLTFVLFDSLGIVLWAGLGIGLGVILHPQIDALLVSLADLGSGALAVAGSALVLFVLYKWWQRRRFYLALRMARITVADLRALIADGEPPIVVDVRSEDARRADPRRIPGARALGLDDLDDALARLPRDRDIVLYCT